MGNKVFVGGLAWATDDTALRQAFEKVNDVHGDPLKVEEAIVVKDRDTGRSRGFGFVTFATEEQAETAIAERNDTELDGRHVRVDQATDNAGGSRGGRGGGGGDGRSGYGDRVGYGGYDDRGGGGDGRGGYGDRGGGRGGYGGYNRGSSSGYGGDRSGGGGGYGAGGGYSGGGYNNDNQGSNNRGWS